MRSARYHGGNEFATRGGTEASQGFWPVGRVANLQITLVSAEINLSKDEVVEVLVGEVVEGSMVVGKVVVDCIADTVVGIVVDKMLEAFEVVVVGSLDFVELGYVAICWQYMGGLGKLAEIHHGPPWATMPIS